MKVAVLMPAYKQAEYVAEALESLINQTHRDWECAVVDDGSPDDVASIVEEYANKDSRIRFYHTPNRGVSAARNYAVAVTSAPMLLPLDADDKLHPEYLEKCLAAFSDNPDATVVFGDWKFFGATNYTPSLNYTDYRAQLASNQIHCAGMMRREDFMRVGGYDENIPFGYEDWEFWIRLLAPEDKDPAMVVQFSGAPLYYRIKPHSRSSEVDRDRRRKEECFRYIFEKHTPLYLRFYPDMLTILNDYTLLTRRLTKWRRRPLLSRLWHSLLRRL